MALQRLFRLSCSAAAPLAASLFLAPAHAEGPIGWFVGGATDDTHVEVLRDGWGYETSGSERGYSFRGGMQFNRNFELELGAMSASGLHWDEYFASVSGYLTAHTDFDVRAVNVSAVGKVVGDVFEGYLKVGAALYDVDGRQVLDTLFVDDAATRDVHASDMDYLIGAGFFVKPAPKWRVRVEYQYFAVDRDFLGVEHGDDPSIDTLSIGFDYLLAKRQKRESSLQ
ncbi:MAG TPA: outer membrane beta-barrel protein [Gammaproteobacteria bacterium]